MWKELNRFVMTPTKWITQMNGTALQICFHLNILSDIYLTDGNKEKSMILSGKQSYNRKRVDIYTSSFILKLSVE